LSQHYFSDVIKKETSKTGLSPLKYRQLN